MKQCSYPLYVNDSNNIIYYFKRRFDVMNFLKKTASDPDFMDFIVPKVGNYRGSLSNRSILDWTFTYTFDEYIKTIDNKTYPKVFEDVFKEVIQPQLNKILEHHASKTSTKYDFFGGSINPSKVLIDPKPCRRRKRSIRPKVKQNIIINNNLCGTYYNDSYLNSATNIGLALSKYEITRKADINIFLLMSSYADKAYIHAGSHKPKTKAIYYLLNLKSPGEPLDFKELFFWMAAPDTVRRAKFRFIEWFWYLQNTKKISKYLDIDLVYYRPESVDEECFFANFSEIFSSFAKGSYLCLNYEDFVRMNVNSSFEMIKQKMEKIKQ